MTLQPPFWPMLNMPYEILQFVQDAADQQAALAQLLCSYGMAYEMMDGGICMAPFYQGMDLPEIFNQLKKRLRYEKGKTTVGAEHNTQIQTQNYKEINMTVQGDLHVHGDYIESGATKNVTTTIEHVDNYHAHPVAATHNAPPTPPKNNYQFLIHWLEEQKGQGNDYLQQAGGNRALMCRNLSQLFDWTVDSNSLGKAYAQKVR